MSEDNSKITLGKLKKKDYKKAINFAITGMHFDMYFEDNKFLMKLYGKYFLYSEMLKATQIIAAYHENRFVGLLISRVNDEEKCYHSFTKSIYVKLADIVQKTFYKSSAGEYDVACKEMLVDYQKNNNPDGEIIFLAADPNSKIKGVGTTLLNEYEKREKGKIIYLYTDDLCTYQFYEHRGFDRVQERDIVLKLKKDIKLKCMLYSKKII